MRTRHDVLVLALSSSSIAVEIKAVVEEVATVLVEIEVGVVII